MCYSLQPCLLSPRWSDPQVRRMWNLSLINMTSARRVRRFVRANSGLTRVVLQMNICRQCFREKSTDIGFNKVRTFILCLCRLEERHTSTRDITTLELSRDSDPTLKNHIKTNSPALTYSTVKQIKNHVHLLTSFSTRPRLRSVHSCTYPGAPRSR